MAFHTAKTPQEMLQQVREYLDKKIFATDIVDVVIGLCCNIFNVILWIFQESEAGQQESISYSTNKKRAKAAACSRCPVLQQRRCTWFWQSLQCCC